MTIDFATGKVIPNKPELTITQSLVKSTPLISKEGVDFGNIEDSNWEEVLKNNGALTPSMLINQFAGVLSAIINNEKIRPEYCEFMMDQCQGWEISDKFITIE